MKILLATLHSKYSHASLALPCLAACCKDISGIEMTIREWTVNEPREHILKLIMKEQADLLCFSCYIWNIEKTLKIVSDIKKISPQKLIVLGGPEVSFGIFELMNENPAVDFVVKGEGEIVFHRLLETLIGDNLSGDSLAGIDGLFFRDGSEMVSGTCNSGNLPLDMFTSPFEAGLVDLTKPLIYYETSRGCPFACAFCLSSVEGAVRSFSMERIQRDLLFLMSHNVSQIKLVDRTFNYDAQRAGEIWEFILRNNKRSHFHFEIAADLLTEDNLRTLALVPANAFRFEIGVQSASESTLERVGRKTDLQRLFSAVQRLKAETKIELHLDLVAGLPGEDYKGFLASLQVLAFLNPHEIQIEPLKLLKGTLMREIATREDYHFSSSPPYTILRNPWLSFDDICRIETIGRLLELFRKHGGFSTAFRVLLQEMTLAAIYDWMAREVGSEALSGFSCRRVYELFARLAEPLVDEERVADLHDALIFDYCRIEMPLMGKLPSFAVAHQHQCSWPGLCDLPPELNLPAESRIKSFRFPFMFEYRVDPWAAGPAIITFVYVSGAGRGLKVLLT
jgi:anaerobic magnesium-protoporphyrin IX monomethyl ester cyclase